MKLILATSNLHKVWEYKTMLKCIPGMDLHSLRDFSSYISPEETGKTFEENAKIKALSAAKALGAWVLADDSGLVIPALNDAPGIHSARYAGKDATDAENRKKLLKEIENLPLEKRAAYFQCVICLASPEGIKKCVTGKCEGTVLHASRGSQGFGYDSLFLKYDYNKTFAEMEEDVKNRISHRRKALDKLLPVLENLSREPHCTI